MTTLFARSGDTIESLLSVDDKALLVQIPELLATVDIGDPAHDVLNRSAYRTDAESEVEYQTLIGSQLETDRRADLDAIDVLTGPDASFSVEEGKSFLRSINAARLTLAARAGIMEDHDGWESKIGTDPALAAVAWLGFVQDELLRVLRETL